MRRFLRENSLSIVMFGLFLVQMAGFVLLTVFLRQKSSPESKPVAAPHLETGSP
jgi:hypothetical protein